MAGFGAIPCNCSAFTVGVFGSKTGAFFKAKPLFETLRTSGRFILDSRFQFSCLGPSKRNLSVKKHMKLQEKGRKGTAANKKIKQGNK